MSLATRMLFAFCGSTRTVRVLTAWIATPLSVPLSVTGGLHVAPPSVLLTIMPPGLPSQ